MKSQNYPNLYRESDSSAIQAQKKHLWLVRIKIVLLLVIAIVTSFAWNQVPSLRTLAATVFAIVLVVLIVLSAVMDKRFDQIWFSSRAIAESVKTESWRFMMRVEPYDDTISNSEAEGRFLDRLNEILQRHKSVCSELKSNSESITQITKHMRQLRNKTLKNRRNYYVKNRINDQRFWYAKKARLNKKQETRWFLITLILPLAAVLIAIIIIGYNNWAINPVGILTTAGAGALSWVHARSYGELSRSYGLVARELELLKDRVNQASTKQKLAEIVLDVERTVSKEHTIWLARRL